MLNTLPSIKVDVKKSQDGKAIDMNISGLKDALFSAYNRGYDDAK